MFFFVTTPLPSGENRDAIFMSSFFGTLDMEVKLVHVGGGGVFPDCF